MVLHLHWYMKTMTIENYKPETPKYKNKAICKKCKSIIESKHRHDFQWCACKTIYVDGGNDYWRGGGDFEFFERIYEIVE